MPIAYIDSNFQNHVTELADTAKKSAGAVLFSNQRKWIFPGSGLWSGNALDIPAMNDAFNRDSMNNVVRTAIDTAGDPNGGRISDVRCALIQIGYLGAEHRAYSQRHMTGVRAQFLSAGKRAGQGHHMGIYLGATLSYPQNALAAGYSGGDVGVG